MTGIKSNKLIKTNFLNGFGYITLFVIISIVAIISIWLISKKYNEEYARQDFETHVDITIDHIHKSFGRYEDVLKTAIAFIQGSDNINRQHWHDFVRILDINNSYPGMQGIGFTLMVSADEIANIENRMKKDGYPSFCLKPKGKRNQYSTIIYLEPMDKRNIKAIGFDMLSEPVRRAAMERARDTGLPSISGRVKLVQEIDSNPQPGIIMYLPLYKKGAKTDSVEARRKALIGFVHIPFRMYDLIHLIKLNNKLIDFEIYDGLEDDETHLLYRSFSSKSYAQKQYLTRYVQIADRTFKFKFSTNQAFYKHLDNGYQWYIISIGSMIYFILLSIIIILLKGRQTLKNQTQEIELNQIWFETLLRSSVDGIHILDFDGNLIEWSPSFIEMLGYTDEEAYHLNVKDWDVLYAPDKIVSVIQSMSETGSMTVETLHRRKDGTVFTVEITTKKILLEGKRYIYASSRDITERKKMENELQKLSQAVEQSPNTIVITDLDGKIEYVNTAFEIASGYTKEEAIGQNPRFIQSGKTPKNYYDDMWGNLINGKIWRGEFINRRKNGTEYIESVKVGPIYQSDGHISHYMAVKEDITDKKDAEARLHYLANFDLLTGLPNRIQLEDRIQYAINTSKRHERQFAIIFMDLDNFKNINDTLGHKIGDAVLIEIANRLSNAIREEDSVARLGGDEFIFLLPDITSQGAVHVVQKLLHIISIPLEIDDFELTVTASIGIAIYPHDGADQETLSKNADTAMYQAKQNGRNNYSFFTAVMQDRVRRNMQLTNALHHVLERNQLRVVYQPQIDTLSDNIVGVESLVRWVHPELGEISPSEFIPLAEESGLIIPIGEWVLRTAIKHAKKWQDMGFDPLIVAVNISAVQFRHFNLIQMVTDILKESSFSPEFLELELTEAVTMHDPNLAIYIMDELNKLGVRMSIDDFGTGFSSLGHLKKFKVYKLKIDQSFVHDIPNDRDDKAIVRAIISMSHNLGIRTIAEGVETQEQLDYLVQHGCDEIQGYYYSKPLEEEQLLEFMNDRSNIIKTS